MERNLVGMMLAAGVLGLAGCTEEATPVTAETSKFRPKDSTTPVVADDATLKSAEKSAANADAATATRDIRAGGLPTESAAMLLVPLRPPMTPPAGKQPTGELKRLLDTIDSLARQSQTPKGTNQQEQMQDFLRMQQQRMQACEQALALQPDQKTRGSLFQAMYEIHRIFARVGIPNAKANLVAFAKAMAADADPEISRFGRYTLFDTNVSTIMSQPLAEGRPILDEIKRLLDAEQGKLTSDTLDLARQATTHLLENGLKDDAAAALEMLAAAAAADPKMAETAANLKDSAKMVRADLGTLLQDLLTDQPDADKKLLASVKSLLGEIQPSREVFGNLQQVGQLLEVTGHPETAKAFFDLIETSFKDSKDAELAKVVGESLAGARKRLALVGQPFAVEGVTLDGKPFDWTAYQGKVVLIDFWATWCGPCLKELPNIRSNFDLFHAKGFDVVGVNLDTKVETVKQFFTLQGELPWQTVTSQEVAQGKVGENFDWSQLPMAAKCGVDAIPFLVLVGKDGKVDSLHVRGPKLRAPADGSARRAAADRDSGRSIGASRTRRAAAPKGKTSRISPPRLLSPVALMVAQALLGGDEPPAKTAAEDAAINPYKAKPNLTSAQLIDYVLKMLDKPKSIQSRTGFADAIVDACDRVLVADPPAKETEQLVAAESKLSVLHREACSGNDAADKQLAAFALKLKDDMRPRIAREVAFFQLERKALDAATLPLDQVPDVLKELQDYLATEKLSGKHLRLASTTVALVNRLENGDEREKHFTSFGGTFAKSSDKELARYGKKLAKKPAGQQSDLVGKPLELAGVTVKGLPFNWEGYRGKVVLVDFWATWCGPCRREMPLVKEFHEKHTGRGFEVVGVSLDQDQEALAQYIEENLIPWDNLAGEDTQPLAEKYGVRAIPTMMLVDKTGKIVGVAHNLATLTPLAEKLLAGEAK